MPKNRNKHQPSQQKMMEAHYKNIFFSKLGKFCRDVTGEDILSMIPGNEREILFEVRPRPVIVIPEKGSQISHELIESIKGAIKDSFKKISITYESMVKISFTHYFEYSISLHLLITRMQKWKFKNSEKVCYLLWDYFGNLDTICRNLYYEIEYSIFPSLIPLCNNFSSGFYTFRLDIDFSKGNRATFRVYVKKNPPRMTHFNINNNSRPAYRIGWTDNNMRFNWIYAPSVQLGLKSSFRQRTPVYIQMHALQRLQERLDCIPASYLHVNVYNALTDCNITRDKGRFLIEYRINNVKVGYLSAILIKGKLVIRTFLFLTCIDTPEGHRLQDLIGLQKLDTNYMKMDKLSTYMSSKLSTNQELRSIFEKADCSHLLELFRKLDTVSKIHPENSPLDILTRYVKTDTRPRYRNTVEKHNVTASEVAYLKDVNEKSYRAPEKRIRRPGRIITFIKSLFRSIGNKKAVSNQV